MVFRIKSFKDKMVVLEGVNIRLIADAPVDDLEICKDCVDDITSDDRDLFDNMGDLLDLNRDNYFYLPGKILHIDGDKNYLDRCIEFYKNMNIVCYGIILNEGEISKKIRGLLDDVNPDVLVITGHDAYYDSGNKYNDISNYKNSKNFVNAVKEARKYEKDHEKLVIIAGACQSDYEELI